MTRPLPGKRRLASSSVPAISAGMPSRDSAKATASAMPASSSTTNAWMGPVTVAGNARGASFISAKSLLAASPRWVRRVPTEKGKEVFVNAETLSTQYVSPSPLPAPPPAPTLPRSFASALLESNAASTWVDEARRLGVAASLAAVLGVALGLRKGGLALASGAAGAPLGILAVSALAAPALAILLALANAPIDAKDLARATTRAAAKAGLLLAGLAPLAALFVVTVEDAITVTCVGFGVLSLAGV